MPKLPLLDTNTRANHSPHVVILGAGASRAASPRGDRNGRILPLMSDFVKVVGLESIIRSTGIDAGETNIEAIYQKLSGSAEHSDTVSEIESLVRAYFRTIEIPEKATFYDYVLLSLREKDVVATFNWDPLLLQAYRRNAVIKRLPRILFLHGNIAVGICLDCRTKGSVNYACSNCGQLFEPTRLLYPIKDKDYTADPFIAAEWEELKWNLERAYIVTIVGYSAPSTDVAAVNLLWQVWVQNETRELAQIEIVDIRPRREIFRSWEPFIVREHYHITKSIHSTIFARYPRRSCDAFAWATLQVSPWPVNQLPRFRILSRLQEWIEPLLEEENALEHKEQPFSGKTTKEIRDTNEFRT